MPTMISWSRGKEKENNALGAAADWQQWWDWSDVSKMPQLSKNLLIENTQAR